jgi:hypothetical protein
MHTYVPWIHKFVMATIGCEISHKDTKDTDKCSSNNNKNRNRMTKSQKTKYCKDNTNKIGINYTHIIKGPYNRE